MIDFHAFSDEFMKIAATDKGIERAARRMAAEPTWNRGKTDDGLSLPARHALVTGAGALAGAAAGTLATAKAARKWRGPAAAGGALAGGLGAVALLRHRLAQQRAKELKREKK